jgi:hypothetical protein
MNTIKEYKKQWQRELDLAKRWKTIENLRVRMLTERKRLLLQREHPLRYKVTKEQYDIIVNFIGKPKLFGFEVYYE